LPRWKVAAEIGVSEDTLERWEKGETNPHPDDVDKIEKILKTPGLWHNWMRSNFDSYRERYGEVPNGDHMTVMVSQTRYELTDMFPLLDIMERDTLNDEYDEPEKWKMFRQKAPKVIAALQQVLNRIPDNI